MLELRRRWIRRLAAGLLGTSLTAALVAAGPPALAVGDLSSDIPGVPLPGPVATGQLGGPIYDVVFRIQVAAGSVIVASLTGTDGTDFDLYLFDQTATTVSSRTGLVAKSNGPTSTEALSHPSRSGGTYYIDLFGATDVLGVYTLTVQVVRDTTPPNLSLRLGLGRPTINQATVGVELFADDDLAGVAEMALSVDGASFDPWQPFAPTTTWTFPSGDGAKTLWAKVRNGVGLESAPASASITLDTVPPPILDVAPPAHSRVAGLRPEFTVRFGEAIDPETWHRFGVIVQAASGVLVGGRFSYDPTDKLGTFVPEADLVAGAPYIVTVGPVTDLAGNPVASLGSWIVTPLAPSRVTLTAAPTVVPRGGAVVLSGQASGLGADPVLELASQPPTGGAVRLALLPVPADRRVAVTVRPAMNTTYRLSYAGTSTIAPSQAEVRVLVRRSVGLVGLRSGSVQSVRRGTAVRLVAQIGPAAAGVSVSFRLERFDPVRRAFRNAGRWVRVTDAAGRAAYTWRPTSSGSFRWRVSVAFTPEFANNVSPIYRWTVR